ncbi:hypothetical protein ABIA95_004022 [Bradyrhizobium sp. LA8.1]
MSKAYLVQVLLPKERGDGEPVSQSWFEEFLEEMTGKFGGATSFVRVPGQGLWRSGHETERDNIAVIEVSWQSSLPSSGAPCQSGWNASFRRKRSSFAPRKSSRCKIRNALPYRVFAEQKNRRTSWAFLPRT